MTASTLKHRVSIYAHEVGGSDGYASDRYVRVRSPDADGAWWASVATASGRETSVGGQAEHTSDTDVGFDRHTPITADAVLRFETGALAGTIARVTSPPLPRQNGADLVHVTAQYVDDAQAGYVLEEAP